MTAKTIAITVIIVFMTIIRININPHYARLAKYIISPFLSLSCVYLFIYLFLLSLFYSFAYKLLHLSLSSKYCCSICVHALGLWAETTLRKPTKAHAKTKREHANFTQKDPLLIQTHNLLWGNGANHCTWGLMRGLNIFM